ncbi:MAG: methionine biosynthesis protein MetW [Patescibacteria group bacterium]|jgi:hypothetical protein
MTESKLAELLQIKPDERILDIGGSMKQLLEIKVDTLVDLILPSESRYNNGKLRAKKFVRLDIEKNILPFKDKEFDICICSHTLEDLHHPFLVMDEISRVAKRGIVIVPSRGIDSEFTKINFTNWGTGARRLPGMSHHNWFFEVQNEKLIVIPKNYPLLYSSDMQIIKWTGEEECVYLWKGKIDYTYNQQLNLDMKELILNYKEFLHNNTNKIKLGTTLVYVDNPILFGIEYAKKLLKKNRKNTFA